MDENTLDTIESHLVASRNAWKAYADYWMEFGHPYATKDERAEYQHKRAAHFRELAAAESAYLSLRLQWANLP